MRKTHRSARSVAVPFCALLLLIGCGGADGPTIPEGPRERTFTGRLSVQNADSLGGFFHLTTIVTGTFSDAGPRESPFSLALRAFSPAPFLAQTTGNATGSLMTNGGASVPLAGTYSGGTFQVTGGGYTIDASVNTAGGLTGSGTAPGGDTGAVTPLFTGTTALPSSNPTGSYTGTFSMTATVRSRNTTNAGTLIGLCQAPVVLSGSVLMNLTRVGTSDQVTGYLEINWTERNSGNGTCPSGFSHNENSFLGIDFDGHSTAIHPFKAYSMPSGPGRAGTLTRAHGFSGTVSGNTVVGTLFMTMDFRTPVPEGMHYSAFGPVPSVQVTLTRQ